MSLRKLLFWPHLIVGLLVGIVMAFLAVTGMILAFQAEAVHAAESRYQLPQPAAANGCVAPSVLLHTAEQITGRHATAMTVFADRTRPAEVAFGHERTVLLHPCTGAVIAANASSLRSFFWKVRQAHVSIILFGMDHPQLRQWKNAANAGLVLLLLSGLVLWLPKKLHKQHLRAGLLPRWRSTGRAFQWSWHNVAGIWFALPLLAISVTGLVMSYPWANALLYRAAGDAPPAQMRHAEEARAEAAATNGTVIDNAFTTAQLADAQWSSAELRIPTAADKAITVTLEEGDGGKPQERVRLTLKTGSNKPGKVTRFIDETRGRQWRLVARFLHTGEIFGIPGKLIAAASMIAMLILVWTGFAMSLHRYRNWQIRRARLRSPNAVVIHHVA